MRIIAPNSTNQTSAAKKKEKVGSSDGSFGRLLSEASESDNASDAGAVSPMVPMGGLIAAQMVDDNSPKKQAIKHGNRLLDYLDELRHDMLLGRVTAQTADRIIQEIKQTRSAFTDPQLQEIIADIELRAAVELAKLGR